jgi:type I restriction enzyme M protein
MSKDAQSNSAALIWSVAEILRGDFKQSEYQKVVLPFTVLRRLDAVLADGKAEFLERSKQVKDMEGAELALKSYARDIYGHSFYNVTPFGFDNLTDDPDNVAPNLKNYTAGFSPDVRDVIDRFNFFPIIDRLAKANILFKVVGRFAAADLHPDRISNTEMGYLYEELIRKFSELSNETAGEHFTPREVIRLMVNLLITEDDAAMTKPGRIATLYDPAAGTGGMLSVGEDHIKAHNPGAKVAVFGQELNDETYAVAKSDMMVKGQDPDGMVPGNSFTDDGHKGETFDYMLANPPFGVDWGKYAEPILAEHKTMGFDGRFGPGLPRKSDGSMLFLLHMISKMKPVEKGGSRIGIIFNASPLFTGSPGGGESEIRRWIIENDWLEAIVALPEQLFYNTGIATYIWLVTNNKPDERKGHVQLFDARAMWKPMKKSLGDKRRELSEEHIAEITRIHQEFTEADPAVSKVFPNHHFGFQRTTVERPLQMTWNVDDETIDELLRHKTFQRLGIDRKGEPPGSGEARQRALIASFEVMNPNHDIRLFDDFWNHYRNHLEDNGVTPDSNIRKMAWEVAGRLSEDADPIRTKSGVEPDPDLRDTETVPLPPRNYSWVDDPSDRLTDEAHRTEVEKYMESEVLPWIPDAWVDHSKTKIGYEIPFTREFYVYVPPRPLEEIDADIQDQEQIILALLEEIAP